MNLKKLMLISLILLVFSLTAVSATDLNDTSVHKLSVDDSSFLESVAIHDSENVGSGEQISNSAIGTFDDLQKENNDASSGSVLELYSDYNDKSVSKTLDVSQINVIAPEITTYYNKPAIFTIHLDGDKEYISNQEVMVSLDSVVKSVFTDDNGDVALYFTNYALNPGTYDISIKVHDFLYHSAITILPNITIAAPQVSTYYKGPVELKIHLDGDGKFTQTQKVTVSFNNVNYETRTDCYGDASILLNDYPIYPRTYPVSINVLGISAQSELTVMSTIEAADIVRTYGDYTPFNVTFKDSNGNYLPEYSVFEYALDNCDFGFMNVGDEGQALINIAFLNPGYHVITLHNLEVDDYNQFSVTILPQSEDNN